VEIAAGVELANSCFVSLAGANLEKSKDFNCSISQLIYIGLQYLDLENGDTVIARV
jgi:hypothetical protein